jgi:hypothetical protein
MANQLSGLTGPSPRTYRAHDRNGRYARLRYSNQLPAYLAKHRHEAVLDRVGHLREAPAVWLRAGQRRDEHLAAPLIWFCLRARMGLG